MTSSILFHTPLSLSQDLDSGSKVRPANMLKAFEELGYDVEVVSGTAAERRKKLLKAIRSDQDYAFCYSEPTTWPLNPFADYPLYFYAWWKSIPTAIFYRDIYWKFDEFQENYGKRKYEVILRQYLDLILFSQTTSEIYVPSSSLGDLVELSPLNIDMSTSPLPPGAQNNVESGENISSVERVIYVGLVSHRYGTDLLAQAFKSLNQHYEIHLDLVCREGEFEDLPQKTKQRLNSDWATIYHRSGDGLRPLYRRADIGIIPIRKTGYNDIIMPVKLFEYLSYGLPIVATNCNEISRFIRSNGCGLVCEPTAESIEAAITELCTDPNLLQQKRENAVDTLNENTWMERASKVASDLTS